MFLTFLTSPRFSSHVSLFYYTFLTLHFWHQTNDEGAEAKIAAAYATDPGASPNGKYVSTDEAIKDSVNHPDVSAHAPLFCL